MKILRLTGSLAALVCGTFYLFMALAFIGWGWSDSARGWSPVEWTVTLAFASLPFLFSLWIAYRCLNSSFKWTFLAEISVVLVALLAFKVWAFSTRNFPVLVEPAPPLATTRDPGTRPRLPLSSPATGIAAPDGKFLPMFALNWPPPGWGFETVTFNPNEGPAVINVYRGTNNIAASNQFLGSFQIFGLPTSKIPIDVMLQFELSDKRELLLFARDAQRKTAFKLQRVSTP